MKLTHWFLPCLLSCLLAGCGVDETDSTPYIPSGPEFKPLTITNGSDTTGRPRSFRIEIQRTIDSDSTRMYKVISSYDGNPVGITLVIPRKDIDRRTGTRGYLKSQGTPSDVLLQVWAKLYGQRIDSVEKFADSVPFVCVGLSDLSKDYWTSSKYKLLFPQSDSVELLMNINPADQWIEFAEKDTAFRQELINAFTQHY